MIDINEMTECVSETYWRSYFFFYWTIQCDSEMNKSCEQWWAYALEYLRTTWTKKNFFDSVQFCACVFFSFQIHHHIIAMFFFSFHSDSYHSILTDLKKFQSFDCSLYFYWIFTRFIEGEGAWAAHTHTHKLPILILLTSRNFDASNLNYSFEIWRRTHLPCISLSSSLPNLCTLSFSFARAFALILYLNGKKRSKICQRIQRIFNVAIHLILEFL